MQSNMADVAYQVLFLKWQGPFGPQPTMMGCRLLAAARRCGLPRWADPVYRGMDRWHASIKAIDKPVRVRPTIQEVIARHRCAAIKWAKDEYLMLAFKVAIHTNAHWTNMERKWGTQ